MSEDYGTLKPGEPHPSAHSALNWLKSVPYGDLVTYQEAFSSCALSGNRLAEICSVTLGRLLKGEPVSDRYLLGLVWRIRDLRSQEK